MPKTPHMSRRKVAGVGGSRHVNAQPHPVTAGPEVVGTSAVLSRADRGSPRPGAHGAPGAARGHVLSLCFSCRGRAPALERMRSGVGHHARLLGLARRELQHGGRELPWRSHGLRRVRAGGVRADVVDVRVHVRRVGVLPSIARRGHVPGPQRQRQRLRRPRMHGARGGGRRRRREDGRRDGRRRRGLAPGALSARVARACGSDRRAACPWPRRGRSSPARA